MSDREMINLIQFRPMASPPQSAVVLTFDLEGFSRFYSHPDVQDYVTKYLNRILGCLSVCIHGGWAYWLEGGTQMSPLPAPVHQKFLGDGAMYLWTVPEKHEQAPRVDMVVLLNRLWNLKNNFDQVVRACADDVPVVDLPRRIRFGLAAGSVYELSYEKGEATEYIGYCINLASRLERYCKDLGFIASARLGIPEKELDEHGYVKVIAKKLYGFPKEMVVVERKEFNQLNPGVRDDLFDRIH